MFLFTPYKTCSSTENNLSLLKTVDRSGFAKIESGDARRRGRVQEVQAYQLKERWWRPKITELAVSEN